MRKHRLFFRLALLFVVLPATQAVWAQAVKPNGPKRDEVYFSIARTVNVKTQQRVSGLVAELDGLIEVKEITVGPDGKATVTVQERAPSNAAHTQKAIKLTFAPAPAEKDQWTWEQFQDGSRFYAVDKIFSYTQSNLGGKKQAITAQWSGFVAAINRQIEASIKVLETARAILKGDPPPLANVLAARAALAEAVKNNNDADAIVNAYRNLAQTVEPITALPDNYAELKANDAYLRLQDEFKGGVAGAEGARRNYVQTVKVYNETLERLPFALVAAGLEHVRMQPKIEE